MNKAFFDSFEQRRNEFGQRHELGEGVRAEVVLGNGRAFVLDRIVDSSDEWIQLDVRELDDEAQVRSIVLPYYQIHHVLFTKPRARAGHTGFGR